MIFSSSGNFRFLGGPRLIPLQIKFVSFPGTHTPISKLFLRGFIGLSADETTSKREPNARKMRWARDPYARQDKQCSMRTHSRGLVEEEEAESATTASAAAGCSLSIGATADDDDDVAASAS